MATRTSAKVAAETVPKSASGSPKRQSPVRTKSRRDLKKSPSRSPRHSTSGSDASDSSSDSSTETSSTETSSSETETSSESESDGDAPSTTAQPVRRRQRGAGDDLALTADKPPRPPGANKGAAAAAKQEEAKSFLMRALAPVTSFFSRRGAEDSPDEAPPAVTRAPSNQSLGRASDSSGDGEKPRKRRIKRIESGERAWWMDDGGEVPEGVARLQSNKSIARLAEAAAELRKSTDSVPGLPRTGSNASLRSSDKEDAAPSAGKAMPEGIARLQSNKSIAKLAEVAAELQKSDSKGKFRIKKVLGILSLRAARARQARLVAGHQRHHPLHPSGDGLIPNSHTLDPPNLKTFATGLPMRECPPKPSEA
ncbi:Uncharacterized protein GBIM_00191 [Gryllus bimaculatus]|nr:Uncharacterized protein GBIM_00191 [Gryllus bimaculatus]